MAHKKPDRKVQVTWQLSPEVVEDIEREHKETGEPKQVIADKALRKARKIKSK